MECKAAPSNTECPRTGWERLSPETNTPQASKSQGPNEKAAYSLTSPECEGSPGLRTLARPLGLRTLAPHIKDRVQGPSPSTSLAGGGGAAGHFVMREPPGLGILFSMPGTPPLPREPASLGVGEPPSLHCSPAHHTGGCGRVPCVQCPTSRVQGGPGQQPEWDKCALRGFQGARQHRYDRPAAWGADWLARRACTSSASPLPCLLFLHHPEEVRCKERNQDMVSVLWGPAGL